MKYLKWDVLNAARKHGLRIPKEEHLFQLLNANKEMAEASQVSPLSYPDSLYMPPENVRMALHEGAIVPVNISYAYEMVMSEKSKIDDNIGDIMRMTPFETTWFEWQHNGTPMAVLVIKLKDGGWAHMCYLTLSPGRRDEGVAPFAYSSGIDDYHNTASVALEKHTKFLRDLSDYMIGMSSFAIKLISCKNIELVDAGNAEVKCKKRKQKKDKSRVIYKELSIDVSNTPCRRHTGATGEGSKRAKHIRRGHFADYTRGKGLFGKYKGRYWIPPTVVGDEDYGTVIKSYVIGKGDE